MPVDRQRSLGGRGLGRSEYPDPTTNGWVVFRTCSVHHRPSFPTVGMVSVVAPGLRLYYFALFDIIAQASVERHSVPFFSARSAERHLHCRVRGFFAAEL